VVQVLNGLFSGGQTLALSERQKMETGQWYCCLDPELESLRMRAREAVHEHNTMPPGRRGSVGPALLELFGETAGDFMIEAPFHCAYGFNIELGTGVYLNAGCVILDTASVRIGSQTMLGPHVQIYCAEHHRDPGKRKHGLEIARPVDIGQNVWIGGGAIILGGVCVGDNSIIGAGSIVTRDVAASTIVKGNPACS